MTNQLAVGIDPGKVHIGAVVMAGDLLDAGPLDLLPAHLKVNNTQLPARGLIVILEVPDTSRGIFGYSRAQQAAVMKTIERATELKLLLIGSGCKVYRVFAQEIRKDMTNWAPRMKFYDELRKRVAKYPFDRYWNDQLKGQGIATGRGTLLNSAHARDAYLYALWGYQVALKQPLIAEKWLAYH